MEAAVVAGSLPDVEIEADADELPSVPAEDPEPTSHAEATAEPQQRRVGQHRDEPDRADADPGEPVARSPQSGL